LEELECSVTAHRVEQARVVAGAVSVSPRWAHRRPVQRLSRIASRWWRVAHVSPPQYV